MAELINKQKGCLLSDFLLKNFPGIKRSTVKDYLKDGSVFVNGKSVTQFHFQLSIGDKVSVVRDKRLAEAANLKSRLDILYEDETIIVIIKPSGLLTVGTETERRNTAYSFVYEYLRSKQLRRSSPSPRSRFSQPVFIVHRLDRDASGILVLAKTIQAKDFLQEHWPEFEKKYYAIVEGKPRESSGEIRSYLKENLIHRVFSSRERIPDSRLAMTQYRVLKSTPSRSLLEVILKTGRKHQIRVHMAQLGCPILGDCEYGNKSLAKRLALHAYALNIRHPVTHQWLSFKSQLPEELKRLLSIH